VAAHIQAAQANPVDQAASLQVVLQERAILQNSSLIQPTLTGGSVGYVVVFQARIVDLPNGMRDGVANLAFFLRERVLLGTTWQFCSPVED
jgi:hypothetical protein